MMNLQQELAYTKVMMAHSEVAMEMVEIEVDLGGDAEADVKGLDGPGARPAMHKVFDVTKCRKVQRLGERVDQACQQSHPGAVSARPATQD